MCRKLLFASVVCMLNLVIFHIFTLCLKYNCYFACKITENHVLLTANSNDCQQFVLHKFNTKIRLLYCKRCSLYLTNSHYCSVNSKSQTFLKHNQDKITLNQTSDYNSITNIYSLTEFRPLYEPVVDKLCENVPRRLTILKSAAFVGIIFKSESS